MRLDFGTRFLKYIGLRLARVVLWTYHRVSVPVGEKLALTGFWLLSRCASMEEWLGALNRYSSQFGMRVVREEEVAAEMLAREAGQDGYKH